MLFAMPSLERLLRLRLPLMTCLCPILRSVGRFNKAAK